MKRIIMASITAVVVIAVLAGTLIPILDDATATSDTLTNDGFYRMSSKTLSGDDTITITWDYTTPRVVTINDVDYTFDESILTQGTSRTFAFCDDYLLRIFQHSSTLFSIELWYGSAQAVTTSDAVNLSVVIDSSKISWTKGSAAAVEFSYSGDWIVIDSAGDLVMKYPTATAYMLNDSEFYAAGVSRVGTGDNVTTMSFFVIEGTIDDFVVTNPNNITITNEDASYTAVSDYVDLYALEKFTFTTTYNEMVVDQTYNYFVVPYQVTAEKAVHFTDGENAILSAIPAMIVIALLLGVVALVLRSRMD